MGLFKKLLISGTPAIDWEMTPEYTFGTFESWGGKERVRSKNERFYYFFIDGWDEEPKLCLMERGIKHARVVAEILAPRELIRECVRQQGKVALFERTYPINEQLKAWLLAHVIEADDDTRVVPLTDHSVEEPDATGLPGRESDEPLTARILLPHGAAEMGEEEVAALIASYHFADQERNPQGGFTLDLVDNNDGQTVSDRVTGLMWQRGGLDIMSHRSLIREIDRLNERGFAGHNDWRMPSMAEALSLLRREKSPQGQFLHPCFSREQPFIFVNATRKPGGQWFVDFKQGRAFWSSGTIPGGFGRLCREEK